MAHLRLMLRCLMVVMVAFGLASAPLYATAQASVSTTGMKVHHDQASPTAQGQPDHDHASLAKPHAMGQTCCHPGCVMAVVPGFVSLATALLPWVTVPIPRDHGALPVAPLRLERPPKHA